MFLKSLESPGKKMYIYSHLDFILAFGFLFALQADMVAIYPLGVSFFHILSQMH